jgi:alkylhydroperoxidase/carboxymuconolactone decarboxylase family protein YurZ
MLKACKKHIQKSCPNQTNDLIIITNDWLTGKFEEIHNYLESAKKNGANVEIYFIGGKRKVLHMGL